jgi:hypothetical protein
MKAFQKILHAPFPNLIANDKKICLPSNVQVFLDSDQNPFSITICQATKIFVTNSLATSIRFWSPAIIIFLSLTIEFSTALGYHA